MARSKDEVAFAVTPIRSSDGPDEFRISMRPHPLVHQELPHDPIFGIYNRRLRSLAYGEVPMSELYWRLRRQVGLSHTGEVATEIRGPEAADMLDRVFARDVTGIREGRCSYQIACFADGGMIMDGVLLRLASDRFWYAQGDGEFRVWLRAQAEDFDVDVFDADVWISQVQGPRSMDVLEQVSDEGIPERFNYFDLAHIHIGGQPAVISRTGFTGELGWEVYFGSDVDAAVIGDRLVEAGEPHGMHTIPAEATNARRVEAGLLLAGADFDETVTPFAAGLGSFVDLERGGFIGAEALREADTSRRTWGLQCDGGVARRGDTVSAAGESGGRVTSTGWSPYLRRGVAIVRMEDPALGPGTVVDVECRDGETRRGELCELPMYDADRAIARGKDTDIPEIPDGE
ncbi:MAG: aminomethyltransferase family protein [Acidimicrobiia bacterium]|nr:aminomethyltransferase family protein [Acidimicrobiia bacterium]